MTTCVHKTRMPPNKKMPLRKKTLYFTLFIIFRHATDTPGQVCMILRRMMENYVMISFLMIFAFLHLCSQMEPQGQDYQT